MNIMRLPFSLFLVFLFITCAPIQDDYERLGLEEITIEQMREAYVSQTFTAEEVVQAYLNRIEKIDQSGPALNSIITINPDAIEIAKERDREIRSGEFRGPLHGIPVVLKDNIDTRDKMPTTAGSTIMAESMPLNDSFITTKLREAGAIILGKANLSEWANFHSSFSSSGWSALGGQTKNPYDITRNPCGSSSGSGVAVSANLTVFAIGTETNGSIVCPSTANGIVGIKPTVGLLSRTGIIPISFTQDTPGPMARTVKDAATALGAMVGIDPQDSKTLNSEGKYFEDYTQFLDPDALEGKRLGLYTPSLGSHYQVDSLMRETVKKIEGLGAEVIEIDRISQQGTGGDSFQVLLYEFKDGLNKYFEGLGDNAPIRNMDELIEKTMADSISMRYFDHDLLLQANEKGGLDEEEYREALDNMLKNSRELGIDRVMQEENLDGFIAITGGPAWKTDWVNGDNFGTGSSSPAARAGYPNITLPMGYIHGLPVGISFFGTAWSEPELIGMAYAFEQAYPVRRAPELLESSNP